jgi:tRNA-splicing ligase RtcB
MGEHLTLVLNPSCAEDPAKIYLNDSVVDTETIKQVTAMISGTFLRHARVMPDCHVGHGCCVGFTSEVDYCGVIPSYVGGDIGCGILTYPLGKSKIAAEKVEATIKRTIPMGNGHHNVHKTSPVEESFLEKYLAEAQAEVALLTQRMTSTTPLPVIDIAYFHNMCTKAGMNVDTTMRSFGTLGGGNHFIEINQSNATKEVYLTIHSGSRSFGMRLFEYHNAKVDKKRRCLDEASSVDYCVDMVVAQQLAKMNRHIMLQLILRELNVEYDASRLVESTHNYIDFRRGILRKGAISAEEGELCIVALNMRDGILICRGKGNADWNYSCAHGCGRHMSRSEAQRRIKLRDYQRAMKDVVSTSVCKETIDEAPQAYKDMDLIISALGPTVDIVDHLPSLVNLKGTD